MLRATLAVILVSVSGMASASLTVPPAKPTLEDFTERRMQECVQFSGQSSEQCETQIAKEYKRTPFLTSKQFISTLSKNKSLLRSLTIVSENQLAALTQKLLSLPINFYEEINGCSERAEAMAYYLKHELKVDVGQVYLKGRIRMTSIHIPLEGASIRWGHHIAPFVLVKQQNGSVYPYSLDLTLLNKKPAPVDQWIDLVQRDSSELLEIHALRGYESNPPAPGDTILKSWKDRPLELVWSTLQQTKPVVIHRGSPLRPEMAAEFTKMMTENLVLMRNPFDAVSMMEEPRSLNGWMSAQMIGKLKNLAEQELRCEKLESGSLRCGLYFEDENNEGFCEAKADIPRVSGEPFKIDCYPFNL